MKGPSIPGFRIKQVEDMEYEINRISRFGIPHNSEYKRQNVFVYELRLVLKFVFSFFWVLLCSAWLAGLGLLFILAWLGLS